ncbi:protein efr3 [Sporothrix brasiliensis 5110]|uniref:Protein efr3 n=1 Tax=Sporothrix brasiliensis 5110 TaxID=1398154 RepID=A0A0C2IZQ4_9PEZI|nr:protein efr3 [Sporothrix brasiliensis 5110]KIH94581.1 protein efr3 [Sporothrix brasiliensis 5110]
MHAIAQKCRPKHQVLILKCYPRTTKGTIDVKPNSSELSYLLYYATSRRSKIQKVGSFLERKTASDVWRQRIGNVQVTLKILEALIEKNPKDLPLVAPNVLKILDVILRSNDITMVESSIPTFKVFCANHDSSTLLADQLYLAQFEAVVRHYASFASTRLSPGKTRPSRPVAMRWRSAGLEAIRAVAASDALSSIAGRQYDMMVPMILENLWTDNEEFLDVLVDRAEVEEKKDDTDRQLKRRNSVATVRTADTAGDTNPIALSGTAMDVDKLAEQDIGVLAILCLKQIFISSSRSLIHYATLALLDFVKDRIEQGEAVVRTGSGSREGGWSVKICGLLLRWAPVQERYIILITVMDALARAPLSDETLDLHITLTTMVGSLLRSEESLIGLSVMDVLLGFIQHIKKLVQMPGDPAAAAAVAASEGPLPGRPDPRSPSTLAAIETVTTVASKRKELLTRLQQCIGDLATHVYYADQISDMVATILYRMKPPRSSTGTGSSTPPGEKASEDGKADGDGAATGSGTGDSPQKNSAPHTAPHHASVDSLFSLSVAKTAVLRSIKAILLVANPKTTLGGNQTLSRNRVPIQVWEGTHWLLRDTDGQVRKAYVDALITWLDREVSHADQRARDDSTIGSSTPVTSVLGHRPSTKNNPAAGAVGATSNLARRAVSSTSNRGETGAVSSPIAKQSSSSRRRRSFFLALLHVVIYDNALQYVDYETDIVLLHVLLYKLVDKLGVNATRYGLPMIFQLQEAIQDVETPQAKVRVGTLVHGYFWTLTEKFRFETTMVGHAIRNEVTRRRSKHFWVEGVHVPPSALLELVGTPGMPRPQPRMPLHEIETEALLPFDDRLSLVENICSGYQETAGSPPQSPAVSPGRNPGSFNFGIKGSSSAPRVDHDNVNGNTDFDEEVPASYRSQMLSDWSRDAVIQAVQQHAGSKTVSLSGSRSGTMATNSNAAAGRNHLTANTSSGLAKEYLYTNGTMPSPSASHQNLGAGHNNDYLAPLVTKLRKSSIHSGVSPSPGGSLSSRNGAHNGTGFVTSVDQLKMALSGADVHANLGHRHGENRGQNDDGDDGDENSDSMASYDISASEFSFNPPPVSNATTGGDLQQQQQQQQQQQSQPDAEVPTVSPVRQGTSPSRKGSTTGEFLEAPNGHGSSSANYKSGGSDQPQQGNGDESVPPVPPLPSPIIREQHQFQAQQLANADKTATPPRPMTSPPAKSAASAAQQSTRRNIKSRGGESILSSVLGDDMDTPPLDLTSLLKGIDSRAGENGLGNLSRPPY